MRQSGTYLDGEHYIDFHGTHDELCEIVQEGDIVTLRSALPDAGQLRIIQGIVMHINGDVLGVKAVRRVTPCSLNYYELMGVMRPDKNMLPDSPGLWEDRRGCSWAVNHDETRLVRDEKGNWLVHGPAFPLNSPTLTLHAPFTKLTITEEEGIQ